MIVYFLFIYLCFSSIFYKRKLEITLDSLNTATDNYINMLPYTEGIIRSRIIKCIDMKHNYYVSIIEHDKDKSIANYIEELKNCSKDN